MESNPLLFPNLAGNEKLLGLLAAAHKQAARSNLSASNQLAAAAGEAGCDLKSAYIAALTIIGGKHAPVSNIRSFLRMIGGLGERQFVADVCRYLAAKSLPGWGNSFHKEGIDPACLDLNECLRLEYIEHHELLAKVTRVCAEAGKIIFPNIGAFSAVVAEILGMPDGTEGFLFVQPRLEVWTEFYIHARK